MQAVEKMFPQIAQWIERYILEVYNQNPLNRVAGEELCFWGNQIVFLCFYIPLQLVGNYTKPNQNKIREFLDLQTINKTDTQLLSISFFEGLPMDICLLARSLEDIDIADIFNITNFGRMSISLHGGYKSWTKEEVVSIKKNIKKDLEFDGHKVYIELSGCNTEASLELNICVSGGAINLFRKSFAFKSAKYLLCLLAKSKKYKIRATVAEISGFDLSFYQLLLKDKNINVLFNLLLNTHALQVMKQNIIRRILKKISDNLKYRKIDKPIRLAHKIEEVFILYINENNKKHASYMLINHLEYFVPIIKRLIYSGVNSPETSASSLEIEYALEYLEYLKDLYEEPS